MVEAQRIIDLISSVKLTEARLALLQSLAEALCGHVQKMQIVGVEKPADVIVVQYDCALKSIRSLTSYESAQEPAEMSVIFFSLV